MKPSTSTKHCNVVVAGEIFSPNLGDRIIFDCIDYLFATHGVSAVPLDLSGRDGWPYVPLQLIQERDAGFFRRIARLPLRKSRHLQRAVDASRWMRIHKQEMRIKWEPVIEKCDAVVIGGGQLLTDRGFGFPPRIHLVAKLAKRYGKPLAFFACGVGACWGPVATRIYGPILRDADYISVRDDFSASVLRTYEPSSGRVKCHPDPAFIAGDVYRPSLATVSETELGLNVQPANHFRLLGKGVRHISDSKFLSFWRELAGNAGRYNYNPTFITNGDMADWQVAENIASALPEVAGHVILGQRPERPTHLVNQLNGVNSIICTRMHAGIVAYSMGKNVIPIAWDRKVSDVWAKVGLGHTVQPSAFLLESAPWTQLLPRVSAAHDAEDRLVNIHKDIKNAALECLQALKVVA